MMTLTSPKIFLLEKLFIPLLFTALLLFCWAEVAQANSYQVRPNDNLWLIAQKFNTSVDQLAALNGITNSSLIYPGQELSIPLANSNEILSSREGRNYSEKYSRQDIDLLARLVHSEAAGEPYIGQVAVAASVLNRVESPLYPNTLPGVIYQVTNGRYQYSPVLDGRINLPASQTSYQAVYDALAGWDPSNNALGFFNPRKTNNQWVRRQTVTTAIGNHIFFR